jgi:hypothetical protein
LRKSLHRMFIVWICPVQSSLPYRALCDRS